MSATLNLPDHLDLIAAAPGGIQRLCGLILELAVRGKLVPQDPKDEPASELLKRISKERARLEAEGVCKKSKALPPVAYDEQPFPLPMGWEWARLGIVSRNVQYGYTASADPTSKDVLFLRITDIQDDRVDWDSVPGCQIPDTAVSAYQLQRGDIVIARTGGTIGKSYLVENLDRSAIFASYLIRVGYLNGTDARYTKVFLGSSCYWSQLYANSMGTGQPNVNGTALSALTFPLPPLAEQHRIVAKVDELMALCDRLEAEQADAASAHARLVETLLGTLTQSTDAADLAANWQRLAEYFDALFTTEASIDALKQTVLQLAVMGKLVPQEPNDEPASELLKRVAQERSRLEAAGICKKSKPLPPVGADEQPFALPTSWKWTRFAHLDPEFQNGESSRGAASGSEIVVLRLADISKGEVSLSDTRSMVLPERSVEKYQLQKNDFLVIRVNGSAEIVGRLILCHEHLKAIYCDHFIRVRIKNSSVAHRFLRLIGDAPVIREQVQGLFITTAGQKTVNQGHICGLIVPLPPLAEQHRIVAKVDELMALCDRLKADLTTTRQRQATLANALIESALEAA